jgi:hypothetical protein
MTLIDSDDLILSFDYETNTANGITATFANKVITAFYKRAAFLVGLETYAEDSALIDNDYVGNIVNTASSRYLEALYLYKYRDRRENQNNTLPDIEFTEKEERDLKLRRTTMFQQITLIDRYEE